MTLGHAILTVESHILGTAIWILFFTRGIKKAIMVMMWIIGPKDSPDTKIEL